MERFTVSKDSDNPAYIPNEDSIYLSDEFGAKCWQGDAIDKLAEYEDTEGQGRLVVLPCAVGDTVWYIDDGVIIECVMYKPLSIKPPYGVQCGWDSQELMLSDFGDIVHTSRSEAEASCRRLV